MSTPPASPADAARKQRIAQLAGSLTGLYLQGIAMCGKQGLDAYDFVFAHLLALRSVLTMYLKDEDQAKEVLRKVFGEAIEQSLVTKHFKNEAEARDWMEKEGMTDADPSQPAGGMFTPPPNGPVH
jgi:hypothetical protein